MQNGVKNGKATQFSSKQQPSPDQKSKGWERKRQSQIFMDRITDYMGMTISEFEEVKENMEHHKDQFTINDKLAFTYISKMSSSSKLLIDFCKQNNLSYKSRIVFNGFAKLEIIE